MFELLGPGDVLHQPVMAERVRLGCPIKFTAAVDTSVVALGRAFVRAGARWPSLLAAVHQRLEAQREDLVIQGLIATLARADHRLLLQLWHLAGRWGRITPEGTLLPLPLTHEVLGKLTAASRSTATLAVAELESENLIRRVNDRGWLLTPWAEERVAAIAGTAGNARVLGETFSIRYRAAAVQDEATALRAEVR